MTNQLERECDTQTLGQTTHGRPNDEGLTQGWKGYEPKEMIAQGDKGQGLREGEQLRATKLRTYKEWIAQGYKTQGLREEGQLRAARLVA